MESQGLKLGGENEQNKDIGHKTLKEDSLNSI